jgi:hypothetical protein
MPTLLETFGFKAAPAAQDVLDAATALREWNRDGRRTVPDDAPRAFVRRRWAPYVFGEHGIDRHYYELCAVSELRNALRAGDVWVSGSRQFKDFEDYLIPAAAFGALAKRQELPVAVPANFELFWNERRERLERELEHVANLAERQQLPDAEIREGALKVTPLHSTIPAAAEALAAEAYSMLPQVRVTDLLLEVDRWTSFTRHAKNALARAVFFNRLGEMRDRTFENQRYRASGLNLVVAAIILWNTVYLERAIRLLQQKGRSISDELLVHLSPLGWEHINLTGDYIWHANRWVAKGRFRPLRQPREVSARWFEAVQTNS